MRQDVAEWERPEEHSVRLAKADIERFSPSTWSFMELKGDRDLDLVERIYADHPLLGEVVGRLGGKYSAEFHMTNDARSFISRPKLHDMGLVSATDDLRDPRVRARLRGAGYLLLYEGKSFWLHNPYFLGARERESITKAVAIADVEARSGMSWHAPRLCMRNVASSTNQRTYVVGLMPIAAHGNSAPTIDGLMLDQARSLKPILASLVIDYIVRMKVSANLNWFYLESLPIAAWRSEADASRARDLTWRLNALGADFGDPADDPIIDAGHRMWARLVLDALVAASFGLNPDDFDHIASQFPIYDRDAPEELRYPTLAAEVFRAGYESAASAEVRGRELIEARRTSGCGFGLDDVWEPDGGWERANLEAEAMHPSFPILTRGST